MMINPIVPKLKDKNNLLIFACLLLNLPNTPNFSKESPTEGSVESI